MNVDIRNMNWFYNNICCYYFFIVISLDTTFRINGVANFFLFIDSIAIRYLKSHKIPKKNCGFLYSKYYTV